MLLQGYYFWTLIEVLLFYSYIFSVIVYVTAHVLSPFTVYQYYLIKGNSNSKLDWSTLWSDRKLTK